MTSKAAGSLDLEGGQGLLASPDSPQAHTSATPHAPPAATITLTFDRVTFEISQGRGRRRRWLPLLREVSGYARPGQLTAVLGPSGSGEGTGGEESAPASVLLTVTPL